MSDTDTGPVPGRGPDISPADTLTAHTQAAADVIDVREPDEWAAGHVEGTRHVPLSELDPSHLDPQRPVITVCRSGGRSGKAADQLAAAGFTVRSMTGGLNEWHQQNMALVRDDGTPGGLN
ncbi:rhodanese-like domain-containing protein [Jatrophihabitans endophyticus]|uniref:rhodanese-like domain-containing protein n=1 Tax=Jatrophihabitans endophyticus TaxID=1206085 RepID=UPI0019EC842A|nr:rhodanese-like domain-containing protein [Jatrophihabitans endophyticus]MBE7188602.1 rhodanese-like domain-containing protein [Jatrophihabitans endophyticus]